MDTKMNKTVAGYHMLCLLSELDGEFHSQEGLTIVNYLRQEFPLALNLDKEVEVLSALDKSEYPLHFERAMNAFYLDSTEEERIHFLNFAVQLVKADAAICREENHYISQLFDNWDIDHLEG